MISHREFSASILCDGRELREFDTVVDSQRNKVTCWIASEAGKSFTVQWTDHGTSIDSAASILLDGKKVSGRFLFGYGSTHRSTFRIDSEHECYFMWTETGTGVTMSPQMPESGGINPDSGSIVLKVYQIVRTTPTHAPHPPQEMPKPRGGLRSQGGICVGYSGKTRTTVQYPYTWGIKPYDKENPGAYVTFVFRYRTRDFLLEQGLIGTGESIYYTLASTPIPELQYELADGEELLAKRVRTALDRFQDTQQLSPVPTSPTSTQSLSMSQSSTLDSPKASEGLSLGRPPSHAVFQEEMFVNLGTGDSNLNDIDQDTFVQGSSSAPQQALQRSYYRPHVLNYGRSASPTSSSSHKRKRSPHA